MGGRSFGSSQMGDENEGGGDGVSPTETDAEETIEDGGGGGREGEEGVRGRAMPPSAKSSTGEFS